MADINNDFFTKEDLRNFEAIARTLNRIADSTKGVSNSTETIRVNTRDWVKSLESQTTNLKDTIEELEGRLSLYRELSESHSRTLSVAAQRYADELEKKIIGYKADLEILTASDIGKLLNEEIEWLEERADRLEKIAEEKNKTEDWKTYIDSSREKANRIRENKDEILEKVLWAEGSLNRFNKNSFLGQLLNVGDNFSARNNAGESVKKTVEEAVKDIIKAVNNLSSSIDRAVSKAADTLSSVMPQIMAGTFGSLNTSWESINQTTEKFLSGSTLVKQTDYLNTIARLTNQGIVDNVEQRALLETIKDKTVSSFDAMDGSLLRLIRIMQNDITAESFGLEAALKTTLNGVFNDSQYLNAMYDTITGAITEAMSTMTTDDSLGFMSVLQSWTAAMYESGVSSGTVQKIANAINSLGSGNVSALASDADMQRLMLLAMSRTGLDYADIMQSGLDAGTTNELLSSVTEYLAEIASNTSENKVLENAYTNLFGITMSDIRSFSTLNSMDGFIVDSSMLGDALNTQLSEITNRTHPSAQISNFLANLQFSFGKEVAETPTKYMLYAVANALSGIGGNDSSTSKKTAASKALSVLSAAASAMYIGEVAYAGATTLANAFGDMSSGDLSMLFGAPQRQGLAVDSGAVSSALVNSVSQLFGALSGSPAGSASTAAESAFKTLYKKTTSSTEYTNIVNSASEKGWASIEEDVTNDVLKKLDKTIMENENGEAAIAVSLEGLNDEVLKSFASIFADEDALAETFSGQNNVFGNALFKYTADSTSNSTK